MAVSTAYAPLVYNGNGATVAFSVTFPFFTGTLLVTAVDSTGVETVKTISTHYTVSGGTDANGLPATGTVTMLTAPATGSQLRIERVTPKTQATSYTNNDAFPAKSTEAAFDKLLLIAQEVTAGIPDEITGDVLQLNSAGATDFWDAEDTIIRNVLTPQDDDDAANKEYVDEQVALSAIGEANFTQAGSGAVARTWQSKMREVISLADFNADNTGASQANTAISNWLTACMTYGMPGFVPPGTYLIGATLSTTCTADIAVYLAQAAIFKGATGFATPVFNFEGNGSRTKLIWSGGKIDNSLRTFTGSTQSGTALDIDFLDDVLVENCWFYAGANYDAGFGDSGITLEECNNFTIRRNKFQGQPDLGLYITGSASPSTAGSREGRVVENYFLANDVGVSVKRGGRTVVIANNNFYQNDVDFAEFETTAPDGPGRDIIFIGNTCRLTGERCVELRLSSGSIVANNRFIDWGYELDGTTLSSVRDAIRLLGAQNAVITGNSFEMYALANSSHRGLRLSQHTFNSITTDPKNNLITGNTFKNLDVGVSENTGATGNHGSNLFESVTTPYGIASSSTSKYDTLISDGTKIVVLSNEGLKVRDTNDTHNLTIKPGSDLTADRILTLTTGDAARTVTLSGNPTLSDWFDQSVKAAASPTFAGLNGIGAIDATTEATIEAAIDTLANLTSIQGHTVTLTGALVRSGAHSLTLTTTATTSLTLPASGTLPTTIAQSAVQVTHTGNTNETVLATIAIPAGIGANSQLVLDWQVGKSGTAGTGAYKLYFGASGAGTGGTSIFAPSAFGTTTISVHFQQTIGNRNSASSQVISGPGTQGGWGGATTATATSAINTANASELVITGQLSNSADTITLESYRLVLHPAA
jgi:parallel beta-helix repeat protein